MKKIAVAWAGILVLGLVGAASANYVAEWKLERKVSESEVVAIGVVRADHAAGEYFGLRTADITVELVLKGAPAEQLVVAYSEDGEGRPKCCEIGGRYIFFLERAKKGVLVPVNGPHGIKKIQAKAPPSAK
jgi:hypothetical protein